MKFVRILIPRRSIAFFIAVFIGHENFFTVLLNMLFAGYDLSGVDDVGIILPEIIRACNE